MIEIKDVSKCVGNDMDEIILGMMSHFCDELCRHPRYAESQEELSQACEQCRMGEFRQRILNTYNDLNDFEKSQVAALMRKYSRITVCDECAYHTVEKSTGIHWCRLGGGLIGSLESGSGCSRGRRRE